MGVLDVLVFDGGAGVVDDRLIAEGVRIDFCILIDSLVTLVLLKL